MPEQEREGNQDRGDAQYRQYGVGFLVFPVIRWWRIESG
jgi:hypothetical protein